MAGSALQKKGTPAKLMSKAKYPYKVDVYGLAFPQGEPLQLLFLPEL